MTTAQQTNAKTDARTTEKNPTDTAAQDAAAQDTAAQDRPAPDRPGRSSGTDLSRSETSATRLDTPQGRTHIADTVVSKVAAFATREIPGVHSMGRGLTRRIGALRAKVPGQTEAATQGVSVEVGEKQAAIDLDIVTWYGENIIEVTEAVRRNVIERLEATTGLEVVEVNIHVDDIFVDDGSTDTEAQSASRVQ